MEEWHCFFLTSADMQRGFFRAHLSPALQHQTLREKRYPQTD